MTRVFPQTHGDKDAENQALGCLHLTVKMTQRQTHSGALMLRLLTASGNPLPGLEDEGPAKGPWAWFPWALVIRKGAGAAPPHRPCPGDRTAQGAAHSSYPHRVSKIHLWILRLRKKPETVSQKIAACECRAGAKWSKNAQTFRSFWNVVAFHMIACFSAKPFEPNFINSERRHL